jgi:hypothetical protein
MYLNCMKFVTSDGLLMLAALNFRIMLPESYLLNKHTTMEPRVKGVSKETGQLACRNVRLKSSAIYFAWLLPRKCVTLICNVAYVL